MYPGYNYFSYNPWITIITVVVQVLFWIVVAKVIFSLISNHHKNDEKSDGESASNLEIIKSLYAKGEITKKEYEELKKELS